jgi:uncharacterized protein
LNEKSPPEKDTAQGLGTGTEGFPSEILGDGGVPFQLSKMASSRMERNVPPDGSNVVVSGLLTRSPEAPTAAILDGTPAGAFLFLLSDELLAAYRRVLLRPGLQRLHGLVEGEVDVILEELALNGAHRKPRPSSERSPDPDDRHLWDLWACEPGAVPVTGDRLLLENPPPSVRVLSPREFIGRP